MSELLMGLGIGGVWGAVFVVAQARQLKHLHAANKELLDRFMVKNLAELEAVRHQEPAPTVAVPELWMRDATGLIEAHGDAPES